MTIEERIERVEKQNRRLKGAMTALCVVAVGAIVAGQATPEGVPDVIRAKRFEVVNEQGRAGVVLANSEHGGRVEVQNHCGKTVSTMSATEAGGLVSACDAEGKRSIRLGATVWVIGTTIWGFEPQGGDMASLESKRPPAELDDAQEYTWVGLLTYNAEGEEVVRLGVMEGDEGGTLRTCSAKGKEVVSLGVLGDGAGAVVVRDPSDPKRRNMLTVKPK